MAGNVRFSARIEKGPDFESIVLRNDGGNDPSRGMDARIVPAFGSNLCRFAVGGLSVIDFESEALLSHGYTGTPVLYPTPNRVRDAAFTWKGTTYRQVKSGRRSSSTALRTTSRRAGVTPVAEEGCARVKTWLPFQERSRPFEAFPFPHRLGLEFKLTERGLTVTCTIRNEGDREIPFGFGLHPYFMKLSGEDQTFISLPARSLMEATADLISTGRLDAVEGTAYDLQQPRAVGSLDLDQVYTTIPSGEARRSSTGPSAWRFRWRQVRTSRTWSCIPRAERSISCIENQTSSTDTHNLFDRGFIRESGLKTVAPGATHTGSVTYAVNRSDFRPSMASADLDVHVQGGSYAH